MKLYEEQGSLNEADCIIGFSFGTSTDLKSVNAQLGTIMLRLANQRPILADRTLAEAVPNGEKQITHIIEGEPTHGLNQGLTTRGIWVEAQKFMNDNNLSNPLVVAQAHHVSRVMRQGAKLGMRSIIPVDLPTEFDKKSKQFWTRSNYLWSPVNAITILFLKIRNQI